LTTSNANVIKHKVTPVEKVIQLLEKLKEGTAAEAQEDAKTYDEFACFCKEQADDKLYAITKSKDLIKQQTAKIKLLAAEIDELNQEIADKKEKKEKLEGKQKEADETRADEFKTYAKKAKKTARAIKAVEGAIKALEESKEGMTDAKLNLQQAKQLVSQKEFKEIEALLQVARATALEKKPAYTYASNDIIQTLKGLLKTFKQKKVDLDTGEAETRNQYEMEKQARENTITFLNKDIDENAALVAKKEKDKSETEAAKKKETDDMDADQAFLDELTEVCEVKAKDFDQRSEARTGEITAITKALEILKSGVQPNYSANKKLTLTDTGFLSTEITVDESAAQASAVSSHDHGHKPSPLSNHGHWEWVPEAVQSRVLAEEFEGKKGLSFVQLRGVSSKGSKLPKALDLIKQKAKELKSPVLSMLMLRINVGYGKDHFVKVRGLIKDLIAKLEADAEAEATQKGFCDKEMGAALSSRDESIGEVEGESANIDEAKSKIARLTEEVTTLGNDIAALRKGIFEATELREAEKADNEKTISDSEEGLKAVKGAIKVLKEFYEGGFVQFTPAKAGRDGKTVGDMAPGGQSGEYHGNQDAAKGIFGLLEVIQSDFERTLEKVKGEEEDAQEEFDKYEEDSKKDIKKKSKKKKNKEDAKEDTAADLIESEDKLKDAQKMLEEAKTELEKLTPLCVDTGMDWAERRARQKQEIEALKEALAILSEI